MSPSTNFIPRLVAFCLFCVFQSCVAVHAQRPAANPPSVVDTAAREVDAEKQQETSRRLSELQQAISEKRNARAALQKTASKSRMPKDQLDAELQALDQQTQALERSFEQVATDGVDESIFAEQTTKKFDWQQELVEISKPIFDSLKDLTEGPRRIEATRAAIARIHLQRELVAKAIRSLESIDTANLPKDTVKRLAETTKNWHQRERELHRQLDLAELSLSQLFEGKDTWWTTFQENLRSFFIGRGRVLGIAFLAVIGTWLLMNFLRSFLHKQAQQRNEPNTRWYRLLLYVFRIATGVLMVVVVVITFSVLGDFLLLTLMLLLLVALVLMLRQQLPHYIAEGRLLLGFGPVREGERIVYSGLPWQVMSINVYSILRNPALEGLQRLPLGALRDLTSRPSKEEPWFPSDKGDYVLLPGDVFGQVVRQTAEIVQLSVIGGMEVMYPSADFFALSPKNLSRGEAFVVRTTFGIDYKHQSICLDTVPGVLQLAIEQEMQSYGFGEFVRTVTVDFQEAGASSLDYLVAVSMASEGAASYLSISRALQQICVRTCTRENWGIPFPQLTLHRRD
jgi:small-conductance mechanosensitive channel